MKIFVNPSLPGFEMYKYTFRLIAANKGLSTVDGESAASADIVISGDSDSDFKIHPDFYKKINAGIYNHENHLGDKCAVETPEGEIDYLSTIFYLTNSIQEYNAVSKDGFGRFQYRESCQHKFGNIRINLVQQFINDLFSLHPKLKDVKSVQFNSKIFLTHDIDTIYGSVKEDGFYALKNKKPGLMFRLALNAILNKHDWVNFDRIMDIEEFYGFNSTFYWLLYKDKMNADYNSKGKLIRKAISGISNRGWENGLHKSLKDISINDESKRLEILPRGNRFHYLKFKLPRGYEELSESSVRLDSSLGFTEQWGFRNSYGMPFMPFDLKNKRPYDFVEVPMNVMDRTFFKEGMNVKEVLKTLLNWFDANREKCILTINFHNNFFSHGKYKGYEWLYRQLLGYFRENKFSGITQTELIEKYYKSELYR